MFVAVLAVNTFASALMLLKLKSWTRTGIPIWNIPIADAGTVKAVADSPLTTGIDGDHET